VTGDERQNLFRQWLQEHKGLMFRVVRAYAAGRQQQEELFQDILVQLWSSIPSFRGESSSSTWVYRVALNTALAGRRAAIYSVGEDLKDDGGDVRQIKKKGEKPKDWGFVLLTPEWRGRTPATTTAPATSTAPATLPAAR